MSGSTPLELRATALLADEINRWLRSIDEPWRETEGYRNRLSDFAMQIASNIPDEAKRRALQDRIRTGRGGDYTQIATLAEEALNAYVKNNPNANREAILTAMDNTMRIPIGGPATEGRKPRDYPLANGDGTAFSNLSANAEVTARLQIEREERERQRTLLEELRKHSTTGINAETHDMADGSPNWAERYGESQAVLLNNINNDSMGTAIVATLNREFTLNARQPNTMLIAGLNETARSIDPSYVLDYYGQQLRVNSGDSGELDRSATVALTLTREDIEQRRIRSVNIGDDGVTTVALSDGRSVRSPNNVVFRYRDESGGEPEFYQMTAAEMQRWIVQDQVRNPRVSLGSSIPRMQISQTQQHGFG